MATATVATAALAKEKIWFDKPSYDKAERQYFEKMAKIAGGCTFKSNSIIDKCQDLVNINTLKSKAEKSKDNKLALESNESNVKHFKCQEKNEKNNKEATGVCNVQNKEKIKNKTNEKSDSLKDNAKETKNVPNEKSKKYNAKEAKEKKNKEDTRNKNRGNKGNDIKGNKETVKPFARNKEQLSSDQGQSTCPILPAVGSLANEVAKARQHIKQSLQCMDDIAVLAHIANQDVTPRVVKLEKENQDLRFIVQELKSSVEKLVQRTKNLEILEQRVESLESRMPYIAICPAKPEEPLQGSEQDKHQTHSKEKDDDDEDVDLFGSDSEGEDVEAAKIREERLAAYQAKKSKKPTLIAKSNIILDVKPWDDETDMKEMENTVRKIETDGLLWGASKLVPLAFGIHKLQISCVVEDDKVSIDWLTEQIQGFEDYVQSVDIAAFNKV
ncbi:elongation factor 1-delta isoform X2 [Linepithema humile]|uniref:elongation factor 1-delta isoform X2 n=1 Tax=Linepithema humile TaxID=83485 RepID=UPI0006232D3D|nr:PREDICTED: elongation factor 1-delta isoform X1 [Linepithema humile]XP_012224964.1 PREDICTED: elongation factor 1-delta isoform X1 [Linepithema humile]XP_012224965.1 PREDICTED: elongation factor 1-delta isoform X1 [Linepithema humile]